MVDWSRIEAALRTGATARELGEIAGVCHRQVSRLLRSLKARNKLRPDIEPHGRKRWRLVSAKFVAPTKGPTAREIKILRTKGNAAAAKALGCSERTIRRLRNRLSIPRPKTPG